MELTVPIRVSGVHGKNGLAAGGHLCALNGLGLAAGAGELHRAHGFAGSLTG